MQQTANDPVDDYLNYIKDNKKEVSELILKTRDCLFKAKPVFYKDKGLYELAKSMGCADYLFLGNEMFDDTVNNFLNSLGEDKKELKDHVIKIRDNISKIKEICYNNEKAQELGNKAGNYDHLFMMWFEDIMKFLYWGKRNVKSFGDSSQLGTQEEVMKFIKHIGIFNEEQLKTLEDSFGDETYY